MDYSMSVANDLKMRQSWKNEGCRVFIVNESCKPSSCDDGEEHKGQVEDHLVTNKETI